MDYAIWNQPVTEIYGGRETSEINAQGLLVSTIADEGLYGTVSRIWEEADGWCRIVSFYGYSGWVREGSFQRVSEEEALAWLQNASVLTAGCTDVLSAPKVQGVRLLSLPAGALVRAVESADGWTRVQLCDGQSGYVPTVYIEEKRFDEELLSAPAEELWERQRTAAKKRAQAMGGKPDFSFAAFLEKYYDGSEERFRTSLCDTAMSYLGVQYRWAGRSSFGIDCSGLVGISYLRCGVIIYRDAAIVDGYPLRRLPLRFQNETAMRESIDSVLKPGDALYFPGHVAMYLGEGKYIHSTGKAGSNGVVINSLHAEDAEFREDLLQQLYASAGLRVKEEEYEGL